MVNEFEILKDVTGKLSANNIAYMLSGSTAMNYYVQPRMTRDIDIIVEINEPEKFFDLFKEDYYVNLNSIKSAIKEEQSFNIIHNDELVKVDFIVRKNSEYRKIEFERRNKIKFDDYVIYIVSIEDLIISKVIWAQDSNSEMQNRDIDILLKEKVDLDYIGKWAAKLNITDYIKRFEIGKQK
jgi:predicted nucleotidyltransferase